MPNALPASSEVIMQCLGQFGGGPQRAKARKYRANAAIL
jgi:hypothetical protein